MNFCFYFSLQLLVKCFDSGNPGEVSYTTATITVDRNLASPLFSPTQYTANINDYDPKGTNVVAVTATDSDPLVSKTYPRENWDNGFEAEMFSRFNHMMFSVLLIIYVKRPGFMSGVEDDILDCYRPQKIKSCSA